MEEEIKKLKEMVEELSHFQDTLFHYVHKHGIELDQLRKKQDQIKRRLEFCLDKVNDIRKETQPEFDR